MPTAKCPYCGRAFTAASCDYLAGDPRPLPFGDETPGFADLFGSTPETVNPGHACYDCGVMRGQLHHAECLKAECAACHHQFGLCGGEDCAAVWRWSTGSDAA